MTLELFVALMCISTPKCDRSLKAYYESRPQIQQQVKVAKRRATEVFGETLVFATPAAVALAMRKTAQFKIYKNFSLQVNEDVRQLVYTFNF